MSESNSKHLPLILIILIVGQLAYCNYLWNQPTQPAVILVPDQNFRDPIYAEQISSLHKQAQAGDPEATRQLADALLARGYYSYAEHCYREVLREMPEFSPALFKLAFCLDRTGRIDESTEYYTQLSKIDPITDEEKQLINLAEYSIGRNHLRNQNLEEAEAAFRDNQDFIPAQAQWAKILVRSERAAEALPVIEKALEQVPFSLVLHYWHARAFEQLGRKTEAENADRMVERSAYLLPTDFRTSITKPITQSFGYESELAKVENLANAGNWQEANQKIKLLFLAPPAEPIPEYHQSLELRGDIALRLQNGADLFNVSQEMRRQELLSIDLLRFEAAAAFLSGDHEAAGEIWKRTLLLAPIEEVFRNLQNWYSKQVEEEKALQMEVRALVEEGKRLFRENQLELADESFLLAIQKDATDVFAWWFHAEMLLFLEKTEQAKEAYQQVVLLNPHFGRAQRALQILNASKQER